MRRLLAPALAALLAAPLAAQPLACADPRLVVDATDPAEAQAICRSATRALAELASCNVPLDRRVTIRTRSELDENCLGLYHCGEDLIEILTPAAFAEVTRGVGPFAGLDSGLYYDSVLRHELAHAAYDAVPCPFGACLGTAEYVAYALQVMFLPAEARARIETARPGSGPVRRDDLGGVLALMAPDVFAAKAWAHFNQRPDPCAYMGQVMDGALFFDDERP